jgi:hypothetical protein
MNEPMPGKIIKVPTSASQKETSWYSIRLASASTFFATFMEELRLFWTEEVFLNLEVPRIELGE